MKIDNENRKIAVSSTLLQWFVRNRRSFPWRETFEKPDPYIILFTEIMLQRTKADQVVPVYLEFVRKYPTFEHLSRRSDLEILSFFGKLGLYWRARNALRLVRAIQKNLQYRIPTNIVELRKLPGVGNYVAAAVACYAFGQPIVAVDSNVVRVVSRLFGLKTTLDSGRRSKQLLEMATGLLPENGSRDFNLALLDFSATVCRPKPLCDICPLPGYCEFYSKNKGEKQSRSLNAIPA